MLQSRDWVVPTLQSLIQGSEGDESAVIPSDSPLSSKKVDSERVTEITRNVAVLFLRVIVGPLGSLGVDECREGPPGDPKVGTRGQEWRARKK